MVNDSLAVIAPANTAIGSLSTTARRLVAASVNANTHRAYAGALRRRNAWFHGRPLDDPTLAAYVAALHDTGRAASSAAMVVATACFRARLVGHPYPAGERTARVLAGYRRTASNAAVAGPARSASPTWRPCSPRATDRAGAR